MIDAPEPAAFPPPIGARWGSLEGKRGIIPRSEYSTTSPEDTDLRVPRLDGRLDRGIGSCSRAHVFGHRHRRGRKESRVVRAAR